MSRKLAAYFLIGLVWLAAMPVFGQQRDMILADDKKTEKARIALVIGNGEYQSARKLVNPANDANDIAASLKTLGFEVISGVNLNKRQMEEKVREFGDRLKATGGVGLFYYAGHGVQANGRNYLIPIEAEIPREDEIDYAALNLDFVLRKMGTANNGLNIVILDACRNNPFARSWSRDAGDGGLAQVSAPTGTFIAYSTSPDKTASDGTGRNGLYTAELLKYIKQPNMKIEEAFKEVSKAVDSASGGKQIPWVSSSLRGEFYFKQIGGETAVTTVTKKPQTEINVVETTPAEVEREAWLDIQAGTNPNIFREFIKEYPTGANVGKAKTRLEQLVWESAKDSRDKVKLQSYLNEFPTGVNASRARLKLTELNTVITPPAQPAEKAKTFKSSIGMEFVLIPAGTFQMGSNDGSERNPFSEKPVHQVTISKDFYIGKYEVTQGEWKAVMGSLPTKCDNWGVIREFGIEFVGDRKPVICLSWEDTQEFIKKLNAKGEEKYRLPTEAEWEYAARAGSQTTYSFGDNRKLLGNYGWYNENSGKKLHEVGLKLPNRFGLYDMHGNVQEMCLDVGKYTSDAKTDPTGSAPEIRTIYRPTQKNAKTSPPVAENVYFYIVRGGCWSCGSMALRSALRNSSWSGSDMGIRLVRE